MKYFLHDTNAFQDEKITELFMAHGYEGLGLFFSILEKLAQQEKPVKTAVLKQQLSVGKKLEKCWSFLESLQLISSNNGETFNDNLLKFSEKYQVSKEKNREKVSQWREKQAIKESVTGYVPVRNAPKEKISKVNTTDVVTPATTTPPLKAKSKAEIVAGQVASDGGDTFTADTFKALNDAQTFADSLAYLGYTGIDTERYRLDIRGKVKAAGMDAPAGAFGKFIVSYMTREAAAGPLLPAPVATRRPAVMPEDPCSLWGAPNPDYDHRNYNQPAGQFTGGVN